LTPDTQIYKKILIDRPFLNQGEHRERRLSLRSSPFTSSNWLKSDLAEAGSLRFHLNYPKNAFITKNPPKTPYGLPVSSQSRTLLQRRPRTI